MLNELNGEMQKWRVSGEVCKENLRNLEGDCLIAASMICYLAPFTQKVRRNLFKKWVEKMQDSKIRLTSDLNFNQSFSDPLIIK